MICKHFVVLEQFKWDVELEIQYALSYEFHLSRSNGRYEHPLLVERREKREWVIPITVHAPSLRIQPARTTNEKAFSFEYMFNA